jgi:hypothetical protein
MSDPYRGELAGTLVAGVGDERLAEEPASARGLRHGRGGPRLCGEPAASSRIVEHRNVRPMRAARLPFMDPDLCFHVVDDFSRLRCSRGGAGGCIVQPFARDTLQENVTRILSKHPDLGLRQLEST